MKKLNFSSQITQLCLISVYRELKEHKNDFLEFCGECKKKNDKKRYYSGPDGYGGRALWWWITVLAVVVVLVVVSSSGACGEEWWSCFRDFLFNFLVVVKDGDDKRFWPLGDGISSLFLSFYYCLGQNGLLGRMAEGQPVNMDNASIIATFLADLRHEEKVLEGKEIPQPDGFSIECIAHEALKSSQYRSSGADVDNVCTLQVISLNTHEKLCQAMKSTELPDDRYLFNVSDNKPSVHPQWATPIV
nr:E3 ubiquitin-protein ligase UPL1-like isoform X1 [Tanacetum cinerariifolium]